LLILIDEFYAISTTCLSQRVRWGFHTISYSFMHFYTSVSENVAFTLREEKRVINSPFIIIFSLFKKVERSEDRVDNGRKRKCEWIVE